MAHFTDARGGSSQNFNEQPARIVSLVPSQTELLHHLGLEKEVIGITKFCIHPEEWFRAKTRVGGTKTLHLDKIKSLQPDLILANKEENEREQVEELAKHFPVWVTDVSNLEEALQMIETIGALTGKSSNAGALKNGIENGFNQLSFLTNSQKRRVCYLIWKDPYLTVGGDTFIHNMLQQAHFENMFSGEKRYPEVAIEELQKRNCELLLLSTEPYPFTQKHIAFLQPQLPNTKIITVDGELFSWYGSRLQWAPAYFKALHERLNAATNSAG